VSPLLQVQSPLLAICTGYPLMEYSDHSNKPGQDVMMRW
jgi:hypothetical protein